MLHQFGSLPHIMMLTLLKIRLLEDLKTLKNSSVLGEKIPLEILESVRREGLADSPFATRKDVLDSMDLTPMIDKLDGQVKKLYDVALTRNKYAWSGLLNAEYHLGARPNAYTHGGIEEMQLALMYGYAAWQESKSFCYQTPF